MTRLVLKDPLLDFQVLRAAGSAPYGGADIGECIATARRVKPGDLDSWHAEWTATAEASAKLARRAEACGDRDTARLAYLRASTYYRTAAIMLLRPPLDRRLQDANAKQTDLFRRAGAHMDRPPEVLEIPYGQVSLPGYFFRSSDDGEPRATVILTGGYDSTVEELYLTNGAAALAHGYNVLAFDGPGQGGALIQQHLTLRPDWENVINKVVDYALNRADVDPRRIALIGPSLGAHLAPRAASEEHRLAACIADCGAYDLYAAFLRRLPGPLAASVGRGSRTGERALHALLGFLVTKPTAGWALRRGLFVHGVEDPIDFVESLRAFTLAGQAERISCPTWVCSAEGDEISESAPELFAALTCEKEYVNFTAAEGAGDHCEAGARTLYHARSFNWLDERLQPQTAGSTDPTAGSHSDA